MTLQELKDQLSKIGIDIDEEKLHQLDQYLDLLIEWNEKINLTAIKTKEDMIEKHLYDCLLFSKQLKFEDQSLLDVGTGAGLPGIPLKIVYPDLFITLLEPTTKRVNFLNLVIQQLGLKRIVTVNLRAEEYIKEVRSYYDFVTARAVARLNILNELCLPFVKQGGYFIAMKGAKADEEMLEAANSLKILNSQIDFVQKVNLISNDDERNNIFIKKIDEINLKYPRPYAQIKKKPL